MSDWYQRYMTVLGRIEQGNAGASAESTKTTGRPLSAKDASLRNADGTVDTSLQVDLNGDNRLKGSYTPKPSPADYTPANLYGYARAEMQDRAQAPTRLPSSEQIAADKAQARLGLDYSRAETAYRKANEAFQTKIQNTPSDVDYDQATKAEREALDKAETALRQARTAYEAAGGQGHSYSFEDRASDVVKGFTTSSAAGAVNAVPTLMEYAARPEYQTNYNNFKLALNDAQAEYDAALEKAGGNTEDRAVKRAERALRWAQMDFAPYAWATPEEFNEAGHELLSPAYNAADRLAETSARDIARAKEGTSGLTKGVIDVSVAAGQMATDAAISAMTGIPANVVMGVRVFGSSAQGARQAGATIDQQMAVGAASATVEVLTEKMFDGVAGIYGKGGADEIAEEVIGKMATTPAGMNALRILFSAGSEGLEEIISGGLQPLIDSIYNGKSVGQNYSEMEVADILYDGLIGAILGGGTTAVTVNSQANQAKNAEIMANQAGATTSGQADSAWNVLTGRATAEQQAAREARAADQMARGTGMTGTDLVSRYMADQRLATYDNVQARQAPTAQQAADRAEVRRLTAGRVNESTATQIARTPGLRAAFEVEFGVNLQGMTTEQARRVIQQAAVRSNAINQQFQTQQGASAEADAARAAEERAAADAQARTALEEEAVRNNSNRYDSYVRGILLNGANTQTANEIINNPDMVEAWERLAQKKLPRDKDGNIVRKSALKMIQQTTRSNVDIGVDNAIDRYIAERTAPPVTQNNAAEEGVVPGSETAQAEEATTVNEAPVELNSGSTQTAPAATEVNPTPAPAPAPAPTPVNGANNTVSQNPAPTTATEQNGAPQAPTVATATEDLTGDGSGPVRERGGSANIRTNENAEQPLRQSFENVPDTYRQLTNAEVQAKADGILAKGFDAAQREVREAIGRAKAGAKLAPEHFVAGFQVANELTRRGNVTEAREIMSDLIAEQTAAGRLGQVGRLVRQAISEADPATRAMAIQKLVGKLNQQMSQRQFDRNVRRGVGDETGRIKASDELVAEYANAQTAEQRDAAMDAIQEDLAAQIPATFRDKFTALRYLNMLGNFKTQGRNLVGNAAMMVATDTKRMVQAVNELAAYAVTGGKYERNTSLFTSRSMRQAANDVFDRNVDDIKGESKYADIAKQSAREILDRQTIFGSGKNAEGATRALNAGLDALSRVRTGVSNALTGENKTAKTHDVEVKKNIVEDARLLTNWAMDAGDVIFMRHTFNRAYAGWMAAHGVSDISNATADQQARAYEFAKREAQQATFHDSNAVSDWVSALGRGPNTPNFIKAVSEGIMPFRKTPANVAVRAVEYSPVGIAATIYQAASGKYSSADVINSLSKNVTGTALAAAGWFLAAAGMARGSGDDDDEELNNFQKMQGASDYSVKVGDSYISLSQFAPMAIPFFIGVKLEELLSNSEEPLSLDDMGDILGVITEPMLEMSMLQGVNDLLSSVASLDGNTDAVPSLVTNAIISYLSQGLTNSLIGQMEQASEENRQTTYTDTRSEDATAFDRLLGSGGQYDLGKVSAKTPGWDYNQQDYVDAWGRTQSNGSAATRLFNSLLNPTYMTANRSTEVDAELERLHNENAGVEGFPNVFPQKASRSMTYGDDQYMTPDEYLQYSIGRGQKSLELVRDFMGSEQYAQMSDLQRAETISKLYSFAADLAIQKVKAAHDVSTRPSDYQTLLTGKGKEGTDGYVPPLSEDNMGQYLAFTTAQNDLEKNGDYAGLQNLYMGFDNLDDNTRAVLAAKDPTARLITGTDDVPPLEAGNLAQYLEFYSGYTQGMKDGDYAAVDNLLAGYGNLDDNTRGVLDAKDVSGLDAMRFALDRLGIGSEDYTATKNAVYAEEDGPLGGKTGGAADALAISRVVEGGDAEKMAALEALNQPDKQDGKRAAIVRRFEAAARYGIPFDVWANVEAYVQDNAKSTSKPSSQVLYDAAKAIHAPSWVTREIWNKTASDPGAVTQTDDYFSQDYVAPQQPSFTDYYNTGNGMPQETPTTPLDTYGSTPPASGDDWFSRYLASLGKLG